MLNRGTLCLGLLLGALVAMPAVRAQGAGAGTGAGAGAAGTETLKVGDKVGDFTLRDLDGKSHSLSEFLKAGNVVVFDTWSRTCPWCVRVERRLLRFAADAKEKKVVFFHLKVNDNESLESVKEHVKSEGIDVLMLVDEGGKVAKRFGARVTPTLQVIAPDGTLAYTGLFDSDPRGDGQAEVVPHVAQAVEALLAGKEVPVRSTSPKG